MFICLLDLKFRFRFLCDFYMFGSVSVRETELWLTCLVRFGQNGKTLLRSVGHYYLLTVFKGLSAAHWSYMSIAKGALKLSVILHIMNVTTIRTNTIHKFTARWPNDHLFKIHQNTSMYFFSKTFLFIYIFELNNCKNDSTIST